MGQPSGGAGAVAPLHVITDDAVLARPDFVQLALDILLLGGGATVLHLRGPRTPGGTLFRIAEALRSHAERLVINDRLDVALASGVRSVQLGARSLPAGIARSILGEGARIGVSTHSTPAVEVAARDGADWVFVGTIHPTPSHPGRSGRGPGALGEAASAAPGIPALAIGGVAPTHLRELRAAGAHGVAVIRGIWGAPDPLAALNEYLQALTMGDERKERA